jgi:hypothetical protein
MARELQPISFVPSRAEGWPDVSEVIFYPDHLEVCTEGRWIKVRFEEIERRREGRLRSALGRLFGGKREPAMIGEKDWFHDPPSERWMRFFTTPPLTISMPLDEVAGPYGETYFRRIQDVLAAGGYWLFDLG